MARLGFGDARIFDDPQIQDRVRALAAGGASGVLSLSGSTVDNTDPANPVINAERAFVPVEVTTADSPITVPPGQNTWYRCDSSGGPVILNPSLVAVEGDTILITNRSGGTTVTAPSGAVVPANTSHAERFDAIDNAYYPISEFPAATATAIANGGGSVTIDGAGAIVLSPGAGQGVNVVGTLSATAVTGDGSGLTGLPSSGLARATIGNALDPNTFDGSLGLVAPIGALKKITLAAPGLVLGLSFGVFEAVLPQRYNAIIQADNAGSPGVALSSGVSALLGDGNGDGTFRWVSVPVAPVWLPAGDYWIGGGSDITGTSMTVLYKNGGVDKTMTGVDVAGVTSIRSSFGLSATTHNFFIYANVLS